MKEYFSTRDEAIDSYYANASSSSCATASVLSTDISGTVIPLCTAGSEAESTSGSTILLILRLPLLLPRGLNSVRLPLEVFLPLLRVLLWALLVPWQFWVLLPPCKKEVSGGLV